MENKFTDRSTLKGYFEKNKIPTEQNFAELIEAALSQADDGIMKLQGNPLSIEADGDKASPLNALAFYRDFADANPAWGISLNAWETAGDAKTAQAGLTFSDSSGTHRLHIQDGTGNVGVGTVAPDAPFHVQGSKGLVRIEATASSKWAHIDLYSGYTTANASKWNLGVNGGTGQFLIRQFTDTRSTKATPFQINSKGYVGIGGEDAGNETLRVAGNLAVTQGLDVGTGQRSSHLNRDGAFYRYSGEVYLTVDNNLYFRDVTSNNSNNIKFHFDTDNARLGIGQTAATASLDVGRGNGDQGTAIFRGTNRNSHFNYSTNEHTYIRGGKSSSHVFINDNGGFVGIGTAAPKTLLHLRAGTDPTLRIQSDGNDEISGRLSLRQNNNTGADLYYNGKADTDAFQLELFNSAGSTGVAMHVSNVTNKVGWVGFNTTDPQAPFHIHATRDVKATGEGSFILGNVGAENVRMDFNELQAFNAAAVSKFAINPEGGVVGIGTINPETLLHLRSGSDPTLRIQSDGNDEISGRLSLRQNNNTGADLYYNGKADTDAFQLELFNSAGSTGVKVHVSNVSGKYGWVGLNTTDPQAPLHINQTRDVNNSGAGALLLGDVGGVHVRVDGNEMQAFNGTALSTWYINAEGGDASIAAKGTLTTQTLSATTLKGNLDQSYIQNPHIVSGMIMLWSGAANKIPTGWVLCNGNNGTPDLRARFVVGYDGSTYKVGSKGGASTVALSYNQMPAHTHYIYTWQDDYNVSGGKNESQPGFGIDNGSKKSWKTSSEGKGQAHENRPPYYALCYIMKK